MSGGALRTELPRYLAVGLTNTALTVAVYWACLAVTSHTQAYIVSFIAGVAFTAAANSRFTFASALTWRRFVAYVLFCLALYAFNAAVLEFTVRVLGIAARLAIFVVICASVPVGFAGSRWILKREKS